MRVQRNPSIIVEVLSDSTEKFDRTEKLRNYRTIPSLELYVLLEQDSILAEVFSKQPEGWWKHDVLREGSSIEFSSLELMVPLTDRSYSSQVLDDRQEQSWLERPLNRIKRIPPMQPTRIHHAPNRSEQLRTPQ